MYFWVADLTCISHVPASPCVFSRPLMYTILDPLALAQIFILFPAADYGHRYHFNTSMLHMQ
jgi:hypothetical protein